LSLDRSERTLQTLGIEATPVPLADQERRVRQFGLFLLMHDPTRPLNWIPTVPAMCRIGCLAGFLRLGFGRRALRASADADQPPQHTSQVSSKSGWFVLQFQAGTTTLQPFRFAWKRQQESARPFHGPP